METDFIVEIKITDIKRRDPRKAARPPGHFIPFQQDRMDHKVKPERCHRQIVPGEPQHRNADQQRDRDADRGRDLGRDGQAFSRIGGSVEPFAELDVVIARGRNLDVITQVAVAHAWLDLRDGLESTATAWYLGELADRAEALAVSPSQLPRFKVGLECPLKPTQARAQSTAAQRDWARARLVDRDGWAPPVGTGGRSSWVATHWASRTVRGQTRVS